MKNLILIFLITQSVFAYPQPMWKRGAYTTGQQVKDAYGDVYAATRNFNSTTPPTASNTYWKFVKTIPVFNIDTLAAKIERLEAKAVVTTTTTTVDTLKFPANNVTPAPVTPPTASGNIPTSPERFLTDHARTTVLMSTYGITTSINTSSLNTALRGTGKHLYNIIAPANALTIPGTDANDYALWLDQIQDFKLSGTYGATSLQTTSSNENPIGVSTFIFPRPHYNTGDGGGQGFRFYDTTAGSYSVRMKTASDAGNFTVGDWALPAGLDQQFAGMPPSPQQFQWVKITASNSTTGLVTFDKALRHNWIGENWWESSNYAGEGFAFGKPRLHDLYKGSPSNFHYPNHAVIENLRIKPNSISGTAGVTISADTVLYNHIYVESGASMYTTQSRHLIIANSSLQDIEFDKMVDSVWMLNDTVRSGVSSDGGTTGATAINYLYIKGGVGGFMGINPKYAYIEGHTATRSNTGFWLYVQPAGVATKRIALKNNSVTSPGNNEGATSMGFVNNFTIDGSNVQISSSSKFSIVDDSQDGSPDVHPYRDKIHTLLIGAPVWTDGGKVAHITNQEYISGRYVLSTDASGSNLPTSGETWRYTHNWQFVDLGGNTHSVYGIPFFSPYDRRWTGDTTFNLDAIHLSVFSEKDIKKTHVLDNLNLFGLVDSFTVNVTQASTITGSVFIRVLKGSTELFKVNAKATGTRVFGVSGNSGFSGTDVANSDTPLDTWCNDISIQLVDGSNNMISGATLSNEPKLTIRMKWRPYKNTRVEP